KKEAIRIVKECASLGMFHMVFIHCIVGGALNEYAICNCCADGCVPFILNRTLGQNIYPLVKGEWEASSGDQAKCTGCGICVEFCPFSGRKIVGGKSTTLDCFGCGICYERCPNGAITLVKQPFC
ncbi:MAG: 4Fe-4S binding protein, partial [Actinomycetota bacterium]|nr:4Fe-4S binding protein [Actinomycetota bacterium]